MRPSELRQTAAELTRKTDDPQSARSAGYQIVPLKGKTRAENLTFAMEISNKA